MNPLSSELPFHFHVHNRLIISLKDFCIVIRKWPTFWQSNVYLNSNKRYFKSLQDHNRIFINSSRYQPRWQFFRFFLNSLLTLAAIFGTDDL